MHATKQTALKNFADLVRDEDPSISSMWLPPDGRLQLSGVTLDDACAAITERLADGYMVSPKVSVEVSTYRPFFIDGAVGKSGQYAYVWGMSARSAVATAEGFKDFADRTRVTIYRRMGKVTAKFSAPLDVPVMPGDTIVVGERWL